jgi:hypothetical protein
LEDLTLWELSEKIHRGVDFRQRTELQEGRGDGKGRAYSAVEVVVDAAREEAIAD